MTDSRVDPRIGAAAELERRDAEIAAEHERAGALLRRADAVRERAGALRAFLDGLPAELAALDGAETDARAERDRVAAELTAAEERLASLEARRRSSEADLAQARRELDRAREAVNDADARIARIDRQRADLADAEHAARAEADGLAVEAGSVAAELRGVPRLSESGRAEPGPSLVELAEWGARAHAALFVVLGALDAERERIVREAAELGASVVGEPLHGASVSAVRRRIEQALA